jgi:hypothetical protein
MTRSLPDGTALHRALGPVGAKNPCTSRDPGILVDQPAESI